MVAARVPVVEPVALPIPEYAYVGMSPVSAPVSGNVGTNTAGFMQWTNDISGSNVDSHFVIFYRAEAINASMRFLESAFYSPNTTLERDPSADVK